MPIEIPSDGDLARCVTHDPDNAWPESIEIVAYFRKPNSRRGKRVSIKISGEEFFGLTTGAPMTGDQLLGAVDRLRRSGNGR